MISSQTHHYLAGFDEIVQENDDDFEQNGLKVTSIIRVGRLAVMSDDFVPDAAVGAEAAILNKGVILCWGRFHKD